MKVVFVFIYGFWGLVQLFAIADYFGGSLFSYVGALFVTYIPLVGQVLATLGAHDIWGWSWVASILFAFWWLPVGWLGGWLD